jgi:hypothetical protein
MMLAVDASTLLTSAVIAALVAGLATLVTFALSGRRERKDRQRQVFAAAFGAVAAYREFPFIVRRRDASNDAAERVRISSSLSDVQQQLVRHRAILRVEAPRVGKSYDTLVSETRRHAGGHISDAWERPAPKDDRDVSVQDVDLSALDAFDDAYLVEVADHLAALPGWVRRAERRLRTRAPAPEST